jgi:hypothetical protein
VRYSGTQQRFPMMFNTYNGLSAIPKFCIMAQEHRRAGKKSAFQTELEPEILTYRECAAIPGKDISCPPVWAQHPLLAEKDIKSNYGTI